MTNHYDYVDLFARANAKADKLKNSSDQAERECYIETKMSLVELHTLCKNKPTQSIQYIYTEYHQRLVTFIEERHVKLLKDAEVFCQVNRFSEKERFEHMLMVRQRLEKERKSFDYNQKYLAEVLEVA